MIPARVFRAIDYLARRRGYEFREQPAPLPLDPASPYTENGEVGAVNMKEKLARQARGEPFEWPDIVALNQTVATMVGDAQRIVELGAGTGAFAWAASEDPQVQLVCSEFDREALEWARTHRSRVNIRYTDQTPTTADGPFDLVVAIEVVEHVRDFGAFLEVCAGLAETALITTPNKLRGRATSNAGPPPYYQHVREWSAGEFYWVLRAFFEEVSLFAMNSPEQVGAVPITVLDARSPLIARCRRPRR